MRVWSRLAAILAEHGAAALVSVHAVRGSAPREPGARMVVRPDGAFSGTIGGGRLEWDALAAARAALAAGRGPARFVDKALGPALGQCCGGRVTLLIETFDARDADDVAALCRAEAEGSFKVEARIDGQERVGRAALPSPLRGRGSPSRQRGSGEGAGWRERFGESRTPLLLFGAGHVGRALVLALAPLPFGIRWIDGRPDAFPAHVPGAVPVCSEDFAAEIAAASAGAFVLVMTHEHALDLAMVAAALRRDDLPLVGLIGSATKRARFERRLRALGLPEGRIASLVCPIGLPGIAAKEPAVIAASVTAQLLQRREEAARAALLEDAA